MLDGEQFAAGIELAEGALDRGVAGPYLLHAAIAAAHDRSSSAGTTDWARIEQLYDQLALISDNPIVALKRCRAQGLLGRRHSHGQLGAAALPASASRAELDRSRPAARRLAGRLRTATIWRFRVPYRSTSSPNQMH
jgi:predicted RNA polymerase sigma factor